MVIPLFKGGRKDRRLPVNYRLISLTSCVARVLEKIVNKRLLEYLHKNDLLYKHQSGFLRIRGGLQLPNISENPNTVRKWVGGVNACSD